MSAREMIEARAEEIRAIVAKHRGIAVWIFGSVARGDDKPESDIDVLVEFGPDSSLFDLMHLQDELTELLGRPVDVVSRGGLKERDQHIRDEAIAL